MFGSLAGDIKAIRTFQIDFNKLDVVVFIGPEGGFSNDELNFLGELGAIPVKLTDTVLRTETAAIAFASILSASRTQSSRRLCSF